MRTFKMVVSWLPASRLVRHAGAIGIGLSPALYGAPDAAAAGLDAFDIVGFHLGLSREAAQNVAESKLKNPVVEPLARHLSLGSFAIDDVLLGMNIKEGKEAVWFRTLNTEFIQLNYSLSSAPEVMYISRFRAFDADTAPVVRSLIASLTEKYGPANAVEGGVSQPVRLYWSSHAMASGRFNITSPLHICGGELLSDADPFGQMRGGNINFNPQYIDVIWPKCGTVMIAKIDPLVTNQQLASSIQVAIGDFKKLQASDHYMFDVLRKGEAEKSGAEVQRRAGNKAPL